MAFAEIDWLKANERANDLQSSKTALSLALRQATADADHDIRACTNINVNSSSKPISEKIVNDTSDADM